MKRRGGMGSPVWIEHRFFILTGKNNERIGKMKTARCFQLTRTIQMSVVFGGLFFSRKGFQLQLNAESRTPKCGSRASRMPSLAMWSVLGPAWPVHHVILFCFFSEILGIQFFLASRNGYNQPSMDILAENFRLKIARGTLHLRA